MGTTTWNCRFLSLVAVKRVLVKRHDFKGLRRDLHCTLIGFKRSGFLSPLRGWPNLASPNVREHFNKRSANKGGNNICMVRGWRYEDDPAAHRHCTVKQLSRAVWSSIKKDGCRICVPIRLLVRQCRETLHRCFPMEPFLETLQRPLAPISRHLCLLKVTILRHFQLLTDILRY